jgi:hypothetical protein
LSVLFAKYFSIWKKQEKSMSKALGDSDQLLKLIKYLDTYNGRDKIVRFLQYGGKFLSWYLPLLDRAEDGKKAAIMESHCSMARKVFRLFRSITFFQNLFKTIMEVKKKTLYFLFHISCFFLFAKKQST